MSASRTDRASRSGLAPGSTLVVGRVGATRYLLSRLQIRESLALASQPWLRAALLAGVQAALAALIALPLVHASPWPHLVGYASLGSLVALFGRFAPRAQRSRIVLYCAALQTFTVFTMSLAAWLGAPLELQLLLLALACGPLFLACTLGQFGPPGALIFVFAASASMGQVDSFAQVTERAVATGVVALLAWAVCVASDAIREKAGPDAPLPSDSVRPLGHHLLAAARMVIGAAIAAFAAHALGASHPGWAAMGAVAAMQGAHLHISMNRALQRMVGTVVGAFLAWLILVQAPTPWTVMIVLALLMVATEMIIGTNYGLGQILVTPMALLMTWLAMSDGVDLGMIPERVLDTMVGATIGMTLSVLSSTLDDRAYLAQHHGARAGPGPRA